MSLRSSKAIATASSAVPSPPTCTIVSSWPATTCALVTTTPGRTTQPEPSTPRPQAVPRMRTTLGAAARTCGSRATAARGAGTSAFGPSMVGNGSKRASALRIGPLGGRTSLSRLSTAERWMSPRSSRAPGVCSATAPNSHARPSPTHALSSAPSSPSTIPSPGSRTSVRTCRPIVSRPNARSAPTNRAPRSAKSGA
jgi:hypothetical protein